MKEASVFMAGASQNLRMMGSATVDMTQGLKDETSMAADFRDNFGMVGDQFNEMTQDLLADSGVRFTLMKAKEGERKSIVDGIRARMLEYKTLGMTKDQALATTKALQALAGESPEERMRKAAKMQMVAGALGMGEQGRRLAELTRKTKRTDREQYEQTKLFAEISKVAIEKQGEASTEFFARKLTDMVPEFGPQIPMSAPILGAGMASGQVKTGVGGELEQQFGKNMVDNGAKIVGAVETVTAALKGPIGGALSVLGTATKLAFYQREQMTKSLYKIATQGTGGDIAGGGTRRGGILGGGTSLLKGTLVATILEQGTEAWGEIFDNVLDHGLDISKYKFEGWNAKLGDLIGKGFYNMFHNTPSQESTTKLDTVTKDLTTSKEKQNTDQTAHLASISNNISKMTEMTGQNVDVNKQQLDTQKDHIDAVDKSSKTIADAVANAAPEKGRTFNHTPASSTG